MNFDQMPTPEVVPTTVLEKNEKGQVSVTAEDLKDEKVQEWLARNPENDFAKEKRACEQEVIEFQNMVADFEATYSLDDLHAIVDLSSDPDRKHPMRDLAKKSVNPIIAALNVLKDETNITEEKYAELKVEWKRIAKAIGWVVKGGLVDHNR